MKLSKSGQRIILIVIIIIGAFWQMRMPKNETNNENDNKNIIEVFISENNCRLIFKGKEMRCDAGRSGASFNKVEGDGKTPLGTFNLREVFHFLDIVLI